MQSRGCGLEPKKAHIERPIAALGLDNSTIIFNRYVISSVSPRRWKNKRRVLPRKTASILNSIFQRKQGFWGSNWYNSIVESTQYLKSSEHKLQTKCIASRTRITVLEKSLIDLTSRSSVHEIKLPSDNVIHRKVKSGLSFQNVKI